MHTRANIRYCYFHRDDREGIIVAKLFVRVTESMREEIYFCSDCLLEAAATSSQHKNSVAVEDHQLDDVLSHQLGFQLIHNLDWASVATQLMPKNLHHEELSCCQCVAPEPGMQCCTDDSCMAWKSWEECTRCIGNTMCCNQRLQRKQYAEVTLKEDVEKGYGIIAKHTLSIGQLVGEYLGQVIMEGQQQKKPHCDSKYVICLVTKPGMAIHRCIQGRQLDAFPKSFLFPKLQSTEMGGKS
jgi:hypothetical protein